LLVLISTSDAAMTPSRRVAEGAGLDPVRRHAGLN